MGIKVKAINIPEFSNDQIWNSNILYVRSSQRSYISFVGYTLDTNSTSIFSHGIIYNLNSSSCQDPFPLQLLAYLHNAGLFHHRVCFFDSFTFNRPSLFPRLFPRLWKVFSLPCRNVPVPSYSISLYSMSSWYLQPNNGCSRF